MKRIASMLHRPRARIVIASAILGWLAACADSSVIGAEGTTVDGGMVVPETPESGTTVDASVEDVVDADADVDAALPRCSKDGFCSTDVPKGQHLRGVWSDGTGIVWCVSSEGDVLRWDGTSWTIHQHLDGQGTGIWGSGPTDVWVVASSGIFRGTGTTSAALVFSTVEDLPGDPEIPIQSIGGTGPSDVWAVGGLQNYDWYPPLFTGRVVHFGGDASDGGTGWTSEEELATAGVAFRGVWGSAGTGVWIHGASADEIGEYARVLRRAPGGLAWTTIDLPADPNGNPYSFAAGIDAAGLSSDSEVMLRGTTGEMAPATWLGKSTDNGQTFAWTFTQNKWWERTFAAFWGTAPNDTWGVGAYGLVSHWDGHGWTQAVLRVNDVPVGKTFRAIWGKSNDDFWAVGDEIALHKTNAGAP